MTRPDTVHLWRLPYLCMLSLFILTMAESPLPASDGPPALDADAHLRFTPSTYRWGSLPLAPSQRQAIDLKFERFFLMSAADIATAHEYVILLQSIQDLLSPARLSPDGGIRIDTLAGAQTKLLEASGYPIDGGTSATLAAQIKYTWSLREEIELDAARQAREPGMIARNIGRASESPERIARNNDQKEEEARLLASIHAPTAPPTPYLGFVLPKIGLGSHDPGRKAEFARIQFQGMILSLMAQRRFEHALMACHFYRVMFKASAQRIDTGLVYLAQALPLKDTQPSVDTIEQFCRQSIAEAEVNAATAITNARDHQNLDALARLNDAFALGEHLPVLQMFPEDLRAELYNVRLASQALTGVIDTGDLDRVGPLAGNLQQLTADFSPVAITSQVDIRRKASYSALAQARLAEREQQTSDATRLFAEARAFWPLNPSLP